MKKTTKLPLGFSVTRHEHDTEKKDYAKIKFPRTGGRSSASEVLAISDFMNTRELQKTLQNNGVLLPKNTNLAELVKILVENIPDDAGIVTSFPGWKGSKPNMSFVLPDQNFGPQADSIVFMPSSAGACLAVGRKGSVKRWKKEVAEPAGESTVVAAALLTSLAGPILRFGNLSEGFILNIAATTSTGKSTANIAATSVWEDPDVDTSWRSSDRGFDEAAASRNDLCLILDDIEQGERKIEKCFAMIEEMTHTLTSGKGKSYAGVVSGKNQLQKLKYNCSALSSSPQTVESFGQQHKKQNREDSHRARLLEMSVAPPEAGGVWAAWNDHKRQLNPAVKSEKLVQSAKSNFGTAGPKWVRYLVERQGSLESKIDMYSRAFMKAHAPGTQGLARRIGKKVGVLYATARLGYHAGIIPWSREHALEIAGFAYREILRAGFTEKLDISLVEQGLQDKFESAGFPKFRKKSLSSVEWGEASAGFMHVPTQRAYLRTEAFEDVCLGCFATRQATHADVAEAYAILHSRGILLKGHGRHNTQDVRTLDKRMKLLVFDLTKLA